MKQPGLFDVEERPARFSRPGDQLEAFSRTVDFEAFRERLTEAGTIQNLFERLDATSRNAGYLPMSGHIQRSNARKPVIRSRVAHVFVDQKSQTGLFVRTVGIIRATMRISLANIVYNMRRFLFLERFNAAT